jgi:macrolide-specific efflux system membrane fusion protein
MNKKTAWIALFVCLLLAGAWACRGKFSKPSRSGGRVLKAELGSIEETVEATGAVAPLNRVEIKPPISGRVERLLVEEGASVKAGDVIAWMSSSDRAAILDAARAKGPEELKHWEDAYKPTPIVSPMSGVIILRNAVVGQAVDAGTVVFAMSDTLIVVAQVDESEIARVRRGMRARITLDAFPDKSVPGEVFDVLFEGKNVSSVITYGVKVRPLPVPSFFRSQMTANVSFIVRRKDRAVVLPSSALIETPEGVKQVCIPGPQGQELHLSVRTGIESGDRVEIVSGLQAGERYLAARSKYSPQSAPQSSPLTFMGRRPPESSGTAPRPKRKG